MGYKYRGNAETFSLALVAGAIAFIDLLLIIFLPLGASYKGAFVVTGIVMLYVMGMMISCTHFVYIRIQDRRMYVRESYVLPKYKVISLRDISGVAVFGCRIRLSYLDESVSEEISLEEISVNGSLNIIAQLEHLIAEQN